MKKPLYYCIEKQTLKVLSLGFLPEVWGNITGMSTLSDADAEDLTWAGYPDHGFYTRANALNLNVLELDLDVALNLSRSIQVDIIKDEVLKELSLSDWMVTKSIETNTQIPENWKTYRQQWRDLSLQPEYPWYIDYPVFSTDESINHII